MTSIKDEFGLILMELARGWRGKLDERLRPLGLSQAKWVALWHLSHADKGMSQTELAGHIGIEGPTLVRLLDRLEEEGWVKRCCSEIDRRVKTVVLAEKAYPVLLDIQAIATQLRHELLQDIPEEELKACLGVLKTIKKRVAEAPATKA